MIDRARKYNADFRRPWRITCIRVFGSYLRPDVQELGDLDLWLEYAEREPGSTSSDRLLAYAHTADRRFSTFLQELDWARTELLQILRNRSAYINVHTVEPSLITDSSKVIFVEDPLDNSAGT